MLIVVVLVACAPVEVAGPTQRAFVSPSATSTPIGGTVPSPTPTPASDLRFAAIQRLNDAVGFVWTWEHGLAKTADGGVSWKPIALPALAVQAPSLRFVDEAVGWVTGFTPRDVPQVACQQAPPRPSKPCYGVVLKTSDGGRTWNQVFSIETTLVTGEPVRSLQAIDGTRAWIVTEASCDSTGCTSDLQRTTDGGATWLKLYRGKIDAVRFATPTRGWMVSTPGAHRVEVRATSDGGATWSPPFTVSGDFVTVDAASRDVAWFLAGDGAYCTSSTCSRYELFRTRDGGSTWMSLGNPPRPAACASGHLAGPLFASGTRGWLGANLGAGGAEGSTGTLGTNDGGSTWTCSPAPMNVALMSAADPDHLWAVSIRTTPETLWSSDDGGTTWRAIDLSSLR